MYNEKQFIVVTNVSTTWTDDENKFTATFGKASLKLPINLCLYNCFFLILVIFLSDKSLKSLWVSDPAPFMTNL